MYTPPRVGWKEYLFTAAAGVLGLGALLSSPAESIPTNNNPQTTNHQPQTTNRSFDCDGNGISDRTVSIRGKERILFGVLEGGKVVYHSAEEMDEKSGTDYSKLESTALASDLVLLE